MNPRRGFLAALAALPITAPVIAKEAMSGPWWTNPKTIPWRFVEGETLQGIAFPPVENVVTGEVLKLDVDTSAFEAAVQRMRDMNQIVDVTPVLADEVPAMYAGSPIDPGPAGFGDTLSSLNEARIEMGFYQPDWLKAEVGEQDAQRLVTIDADGYVTGFTVNGDVIVNGPIAAVTPPLTWSGHPAGERGDWMQTASGRAFYPMDPRPAEIHIEDIAAALSKMCRYGGHTTRFYSVAEHCVLMSRAASPSVAFEALMHDASEAYLSDVIRPIKPFLSNYREIEERLERAIAKRFDMQWPMPAEVKRLDNAILADERDQVMAPPPKDWRLPEPPLGVTLQFWSPEKAEYEFLAAFARLRG